MKLLLQADDVMSDEKIAVRAALIRLGGDWAIRRFSLAELVDHGRRVPPDFTPIGTVEFCQARMRQCSVVQPAHFSYPPAVRSFLGRNVQVSRFCDVPKGFFVKPLNEVKQFTGHIKGHPLAEDSSVVGRLGEDLVWTSEPLQIQTEVRYYISAGAIVGFGRYDDGPDDAQLPELKIFEAAVKAMNANTPPLGYALDFGVTDDGKTVFVEANDGWALGLYRSGDIVDEEYLKLISNRWAEIAKH